MSSDREFSVDDLSNLERGDRFEKICDEFEQAWKIQKPLVIEEILAKYPDLPRPQLLSELIKVDRYYREGAGESPKQEEYLGRFPADKETIDRVWHPASGETTPPWNDADPAPPPPPPPEPQPKQLGRFPIIRELGRGGYGIVYLAQDLKRGFDIALKVPHRHLLESPDRRAELEKEARIGKELNHSHLVKTLDIEVDGEQLYILLQFINGSNLSDWSVQHRPTPRQVAELMIPVAQALAYLHEKDYFHRDVKPANILIGLDQTPYLADYGLLLHEDEKRRHKGWAAGTYAYMAPEQIKGATNLIDGQSDLWSVGVMMYRLFTNRFPYGGRPPSRDSDNYSEYLRDLASEIVAHDPKPPRMIRRELHKKLEKICLRCLEQRKRDRYKTALDLAEDLQSYLETPDDRSQFMDSPRPIHIVPKGGLRSFDASDAEFFLELLPGPRTSAGLPSSLSYWRNRLSGMSGDSPIDVGVIYGPSGCGKSSLVRAGLLPILGEKFVPLIIEATGQDTEVRLLKALRQAVPDLPADADVIAACAHIGEHGAGSGRKILMVFDQFEQWLHSEPVLAGNQLILGLRHCNGSRLQALFLVRDEFWTPLSRFMEQLEIPLQENNNTAAVDLFDLEHARKILVAFGRAYSRLPTEGEPNADQKRFLDSAIEGLAEAGRIICVRLALFSEMMKDRPWTPQELEAVGGAKGIGVAFLEQKFGRNAPPMYRPYRNAVRKVLDKLMPPFGSDLKGQMCTTDELRMAAECSTDKAFDQLIQILNTDLKLLTPTVADNPDGRPQSANTEPSSYQLTHDFLVPSVREWLSAELGRTRAGRAQLLLRERAEDWIRQPESRRLPSLLETAQIMLRTRSTAWTESQARMMRQSQVWHGRHLSAFGLLLVCVLIGATVWYHSNRQAMAEAAVDRLMAVEIGRVNLKLREMDATRDIWSERVRRVADRPDTSPSDKLRAELALVSHDQRRLNDLLQLVLVADAETVRVVRDWLAVVARIAPSDLWTLAQLPEQSAGAQLRIAALLAEFDPHSADAWQAIAGTVANTLVTDVSLDADAWSELLKPVRERLAPALSDKFLNVTTTSAQRLTAAQLLSKLGSTELLCRLVPDADAASLSLLTRSLSRDRAAAIACLRPTLDAKSPEVGVETRLRHIGRQRTTAVALIFLGQDDLVWPLLSASPDGSLRTELILTMRKQGVPLEILLRAEETVSDPVARQAIWQSMAASDFELPSKERIQIARRIQSRLPLATRFSERAGMIWLAQRCGLADGLRAIIPRTPLTNCDWSVNSQGQTLVEIRGPVEFQMGSPEGEPRRDGNERPHRRRIERSFAVGMQEVTAEQFRCYRPTYAPDPSVCASPDCPASFVSWLDAAKYCRWLSEQEEVPEDQMCYPPVDQIHVNMELPNDQLSRTGYRLPTEAEWEFACRGGTTTRYFFGEDERHLSEFGWWLANSSERTWPAGQMRPNPFGLFDVEGNLHEWCQDAFGEYPKPEEPQAVIADDMLSTKGSSRVFRGAAYRSTGRSFRVAFRYHFPAEPGYSVNGFRLARTVPQK